MADYASTGPALPGARSGHALPGEPSGHELLRRKSGWVLLGLVTLAHLLAVDELAADRFGWGAGEHAAPRIEVAFVRELAQSAAPALATAPAAKPAAAPRLPAVASAPVAQAAAAKAAAPPEPVPAAEPEPAAVLEPMRPAVVPPNPTIEPTMAPRNEPVVPLPPPVAEAPASGAATVQAATAAASAVAFDWPPSTRLSYNLTGNYRGPAFGSAKVEWLRSGTHYQVLMESAVGGGLFSRKITSDGELGERGLQPRRFDAEQKLLFRAPRRWGMVFGSDRATLADGGEVPLPPGTQDEASQFVQLTWLFTTQPQLLRVGQTIELPLAINKRIDRWIFDVKEEQTLNLPFGAVTAFYVKPRREAKGGEMTAEMWFAPRLQYLPVRILIRQDESTYVDLTLDKPPLQAAK